MKYKLSDIARICGGELSGQDRTVESVFTDSRSSSYGASPLFAAIAGINHDGHAHVSELYYRGVRSFLIERDIRMDAYPDAGFVRVENTVEALQALAADYRAGFRGTVVGVTGSNGKTIVKEWIAQLLPPSVKMFRSPKSYNSQIGVPLSVLMIEGDEEVAVIEAGISQPGEMARLARIIRPDVGIMTTLGDAHQENFGSMDEKLDEKLNLFDGARTIIYSSHYPQVAARLVQRFGLVETRGGATEPVADAALVDAACADDVLRHFTDRASQENAALALTLLDVLGYDHAQTCLRLSQLQPVAMRLELKEGLNDSLIVNDSYNADVNSLGLALDYLSGVAGGRPRTLVISDILQSGFSEDELYRRVAQLAEKSGVTHVMGIGARIAKYEKYFTVRADFYPSTDAFLASVGRDETAGRAILVKGNRSSQFERISHALQRKSHTTTLEVDLDAMIHNLNAFRAKLRSGVRVMAMVKAGAYGHGGLEVARMLQRQGVQYLAVAFADEGVALREKGITVPIVVLNADADSFELMVSNGLEPEIYNFSSLADFTDVVRRHGERDYPVHLKLDTGMHRLGFSPDEADPLIAELIRNKHQIRVMSVFTHLAAADDPAEDDFTRAQVARFDAMSVRIAAALPYEVLRHAANSAALVRFPETQFDMIRLGIGLYGVGTTDALTLRPVASLKSRIVQIKDLDAGQTVGYGRAGRLVKPTRVATVPVGYADGLDRRLGNGRWSLRVNGVSAPLVGRVCMDSCMADVTGIDLREGDEVTIYGSETGHTIVDMACVLDTIPYEIMTSISTRVKRVFMKE